MTRTVRAILFFSTGFFLFTCAGFAQMSPADTRQLIKDAVYNELHDRECDSFWSYHIEQKVGSVSNTRQQVETKEGPIFRVLAENGKPLDFTEEQKEQARLDGMLNNPHALEKNRQDHEQDEERMQRVLGWLPDAFVYQQDSPASGDIVTLRFSPNPNFKPPTYEARVFHGLAGTIQINQRLKRIVALRGTVINRIEFGYGLLGYVNKGGSFQIHREQVSTTHWKTDLVDVHVSGRVILLKSVSKDHHEVRSEFEPVSSDISLDQARHLLDQAVTQNDAQVRAALR